jgi:hypothetical protein
MIKPIKARKIAVQTSLSDVQVAILQAHAKTPCYRLEVVLRSVQQPTLTRSERRSWQLRRRLSSYLTRSSLDQWHPAIEGNLERLRGQVTGEPHVRHLDKWSALVQQNDDVLGLHRVLTGLDRESIEMREVSPRSGLLAQSERREVLAKAG